MKTESIVLDQVSFGKIVLLKVRDIMLLTKFRLASLVVFSAVMAYLLAMPTSVDMVKIVLLSFGGFLVTGSSNAINQIIEKDIDKLMNRTKERPLPAGRMTLVEACLIAGISGIAGILVLGFAFNSLSGLLGALALISYGFIYTPFKRISPAVVFIGGVPGSMPLLIGWTAATGTIGLGGIILFTIQFFWQIPHFWAIAWLLNDDYKRGGYNLLPAPSEKNNITALQNIPYLVCLIAVSILPYVFGFTGIISLVVAIIAGVYFLMTGIQLATDVTDKSAKRLMFASFAYLPIVFIAYVLDKI